MTQKFFWFTSIVALLIAVAVGIRPALAAEYHIGAGQQYANLAALRAAVTTLNNDTLIFHDNVDASLAGGQGTFSVRGTVNIISNINGTKRTISQLSGYSNRVFDVYGTLNISSDITFDGIQSTSSGTMFIQNGGIVNAEGVTFTNNVSQIFGGAIDTNSGASFVNVRGAHFEGNTGGRGGGVEIYYTDAADFTDATFINNTATSEPGGAIFVTGGGNTTNIIMGATAGNISLYEGNKYTNLSENLDIYNSLHCTGSGTYNINIVTEGAVRDINGTITKNAGILDLKDPIFLREGYNYQVNITKTGEGIWKLGGDSQINTGSGQAAISIDQGQLFLYQDAKLQMTGEHDSFTVQRGAIVYFEGNNVIQGTSVLFNAGALMTFDLSYYFPNDYPAPAENTDTPMLRLSGETLQVTGTRIDVNGLPNDERRNGDYVLIEGTSPLTIGDFNLYISGTNIDVSGTVSDRLGYSLGLRTDESGKVINDKQLVLSISETDNTVLRWTSSTPNGQWSVIGDNWTLIRDNTTDSFIPGDTVQFFDSGSHTIELLETVAIGHNSVTDTAGKTWYNNINDHTGMHVSGDGNWTFTGVGSITDYTITGSAALLFDGTGSLTLANRNANTYSGGTNLAGTGTLNVSRGDQLGLGSVNFLNNGTADQKTKLHFNGTTTLTQQLIAENGSKGLVTVDNSKKLTITRTANETETLGSAVYVKTGGELTIQANAGSRSENIVFNLNGTKSDGSLLEKGAAVYVESGGRFNASNTAFTNNKVQDGGGVVYNEGITTIQSATFTKNTGSAVSAAGNSQTEILDSTFTDNITNGTSGTIHYQGSTGNNSSLTIGATENKTTTFSGNVANNVANSIYITAVSNGTANVIIDTKSGGVVDMRDPIATGNSNYRANITKTGDGTWKLAGDNVFTAGNSTTFQISAGTVDLYKADTDNKIEAGKITAVTNGSFVIDKDGTLNSYGGNTINVSTINLADGATLGFDLTTSTTAVPATSETPAKEASPALLNLTASTWNVNNWKQNINLLALNTEYKSGVFNLMTVEGATINVDNIVDNMTLLYRGEEMKQFRTQNGELQFDTQTKTLQVKISDMSDNGVTKWTGQSGNSTWDATSLNWEGQGDLIDTAQFLHGDAVIFTNDGAGTITINAGGVEIAQQITQQGTNPGMVVNNSREGENSNDYVFTGGSINDHKKSDPDNKTGGLLKQGSGTVTFTQENYFSGGTVIEGGRVVAQKVTSLGTGDVTLKNSGTVLEFNLDVESDGKFDQQISGSGQLVKSGGGSLTLTNNQNRYTGGTTILGGTLIAKNFDAIGTGDIITGIDDHSGTIVFELEKNETFNKTISGTGAIKTNGKGQLTLSQENNYSGGTTIGTGTVILAKNLAAIGTGDIRNDGKLILDIASDGVLVQSLTGNGNLEKKGNGILELKEANLFYGSTTLSAGTLLLNDESTLQNSLLDYRGGNLDIQKLDSLKLGGLAGTQNLSLNSSSNEPFALTIGASDVDSCYSGKISGVASVTKIGSGTQIFSGNNTYSGGTLISGGRLVSVGVSGFGTGNVLNNAEMGFEINTSEETYENLIVGSGSLWKTGSGTLKLVGENDYQGGTIIEDGRLSVSTIDSLGTGFVSLRNEKASLYLDIAADETFSQNISGAGSVYKSGTGTLTFENNLNVTGSAHVLDGAMFVNAEAKTATTVHDGAVLGGRGFIDNDVTFLNGSSHVIGQKDNAKLVAFSAKNVTYKGGSTVYVKVGMNGNDQVIAKNGFNFAQGGGVVNVVLLNLGLHDFDPETTKSPTEYTIFVAESGKLLLNGTHISSSESDSDTLTIDDVKGEVRFLAAPEEGLNVLGYSVKTIGDVTRSLSLNLAATGPGAVAYLNSNQRAALQGIGDAEIFDRIYSYNKESRGAVIDQTMPIIQSAMPFLSERSVTQFNLAAFERLRFLREPLALTDREVNAYRGSSHRLAHIHSRNNYLWFQNFGDFIRMSGRNGVPEFQADSYGFSVGIDRGINHHSSVGLGMGGYFSDINANDIYQKGDTGSYLISLYGNWINDDNWMMTGSTGFVFSSYELTRTAPTFNTTLNSKHCGTTLFASLEGSKKLLFGKYEVSPYLGADFIWLGEEGYRERTVTGLSSMALNIKSRDTFTVLSTVGVRLGRSMRLLGGNLVNPSLYAAWIHDWTESDIVTTASFFGEPAFRIRGASMNRDRAQLGVNLNMTLNKRTDMFTRFNAELATRYSDLSFHLGIRFGF
ncbi:MAG: autotransporter domain-containing protein [Planctomycetaceae bacterium]|jgi:autotransporter-associated beta strand protein|nr:autotransporter domain-containing protein [Planctomycetaceae bacterium]